MSGAAPDRRFADAALAAALMAVDPAGTGAALRAPPGPARDRWLALLRGGLPASAPVRRVPCSVPDGRLLGGLDLAATLAAGRPVAERGLLAEADGGVAVVAMAERLPPGTAARLAAAMDDGAVSAERDGLALRHPARFGVVALDEGIADDERPPAALLDRLAFRLEPDGAPDMDAAARPAEIAAARARLPGVGPAGDGVLDALCGAAMALGIDSPRAPLLALRVARAAAALAGRGAPSEADAAVAARLVLAPRATRLPASPEQAEDESADSGESDPPPDHDGEKTDGEPSPDSMQDMLVAAAVAALPAGLLAGLAAGAAKRSGAATEGGAGAFRRAVRRGRRTGARPGDPRAGVLDLVETLRAAAPWQRLRRGGGAPPARRVEIRREDFRLARFRQRAGATTLFVVDASGSAALNRLAEAKGAVELLLADCYARRDQVALLAFRGRGAELLLPPTGALARAKRSLAALPGGGGTPLAAGLDAALALAEAERRRGRTPTVVVLTDGRANIARDGAADRARAEADASAAARLARAKGFAAVLVDTAPRPRPFARELAAEMGARYLPLPGGDAAVALAETIRSSSPGAAP